MKKAVAMIAASVMVISLAGCGAGGSSSKTESKAASSEAAASTASSTAAASTASSTAAADDAAASTAEAAATVTESVAEAAAESTVEAVASTAEAVAESTVEAAASTAEAVSGAETVAESDSLYPTPAGVTLKGASYNEAAPDWTEYTELIAEIKSNIPADERVAKMHQAEDILMATGAVIPIYYYNDLYLQKTDVEGIYSNLFGFKYFQAATSQ